MATNINNCAKYVYNNNNKILLVMIWLNNFIAFRLGTIVVVVVGLTTNLHGYK